MILADANLLVYSLHADTPKHAASKAWLDQALNGDEPLALCWLVAVAVIRITTNTQLFPAALTVEQALAVLDGWLEQPSVLLIQPGPDHWSILSGLLREIGTAGNLTNDAHLAALAIEHNCTLCSADADFRRFAGLRFHNPLSGGGPARREPRRGLTSR